MRIRIGRVVTLGSVLVAAACGGSSDDDGLGGVALSDLPDRIAQAACKAVQACYGGLTATVLNGEDCVQRTRNSFADSLPTIEAADKAGTAKYDGDKAVACIKLVEQAGCDIESAFESPTCRAAVDGTVEVGGSCTSDIDCVGSAFCKSSASCAGTCTAAGAVGASCEHDAQCDDGLQCDETTGKCYQAAAEGAACKGTSAPDCGAGLFCLGQDENTGKSGTCKAISTTFTAADGAACDPTQGPLCEAESHCVIQSFSTSGIVAQCGAEVASGAACKLAFPDQCPSGEYCKVVPDTVGGTCTSVPKANEACVKSTFADDLCDSYLRCDAGMCKPLQSLGGACTDDKVCLSESCSAGKCVPQGGCST